MRQININFALMIFKVLHKKISLPKVKFIVVSFALAIFLNFTFAIQYVNLNDFDMTLTEVVEEEEQEVHKNDLLDILVNNNTIISLIDFDLKDQPLLCKYHTDVLTPPPELS